MRDDNSRAPTERRDARPITPIHVVEFAAARALLAFFRLIGVDAASALAGRFLRIVGPLIRPISRRAEANLKTTFPEWAEARRRSVVAGVWENLGRTGAEFAHLDKLRPSDAGGRTEIVDAGSLGDVARGARPVIFVSGHFANWEAMPVAIHGSGVDYAFVYRAANNPLVDRLIIALREKAMSRVQIPKGKRGGRSLIEALQSGRSLAMLVDQKLNDGIAVPFLGREAMTAPAAARLSLKFAAPIVPVSLERLGGVRFKMTVHEPISFAPSGDATADVRALTILINEALERDIRARPEQWLWLHRRWPKGENR